MVAFLSFTATALMLLKLPWVGSFTITLEVKEAAQAK